MALSGYCRAGVFPKSFVGSVAFDVVCNIQLFRLRMLSSHNGKTLSFVSLKVLFPFIFIANTAGYFEWIFTLFQCFIPRNR